MEIRDQFQLKTIYTAGRTRLREVLFGAADSGVYQQTTYISADFFNNLKLGGVPSQAGLSSVKECLVQIPEIDSQIRESETGAVIFKGDQNALVILPPFPITEVSIHTDVHILPVMSLLEAQLVVGVIFLRLGRYAVGVFGGDALLASKTGTRHVKNRHRQGGSSQRRFERSRERLIREFYDKACVVAGDVLSPFRDSIDYLMFGGEKHTLNGFGKRCRLVRELEKKTLNRRLPVGRPGQKALESATKEMWVGKVLVFSKSCA